MVFKVIVLDSGFIDFNLTLYKMLDLVLALKAIKIPNDEGCFSQHYKLNFCFPPVNLSPTLVFEYIFV